MTLHARSARSLRRALCATIPLILFCTTCTRVRADELQWIAELLSLHAGASVADVGAGDGEYSFDLAERVGRSGRVYATEVDEDDLEEIRERAEDEGIGNLLTVLGSDADTGLPAACCDSVLLRLVYHHFTEPAKMRESLRRAMRPGSVLLVIEIEPQKSWAELEGVPDRGGHGIPPEMLVDELTSDGFELLERFDEWFDDEDKYAALFRLADDTTFYVPDAASAR